MFYIIRHGKTDWNEIHKLQGRTDVPLNDNGRKMAKIAAEEYADVHFDVCYCSPLIRAKETAQILLEGRDVPIIYDDRLMEMAFGIYEGIQNCFEKPECPVRTIFLAPQDYTAAFEGAESWDDLFKRTGSFLEEIVYPLVKEGKDVLVVAHGGVNSCITTQVRNKPIEEFWSEPIENCKLKRLI